MIMKKSEIKQIIELGDAIDSLKIALDEVIEKYTRLEGMLEKDHIEVYIEEAFKRR